MDLSSLKTQANTVDFIPKSPVAPFADLPIVLKVVTQDSEQVKAIERRIINRRLQIAKTTRRPNITSEDLEEENLQKIAGSIVGWEGVNLNGALPYSHDNAIRVLRELPWLFEQVEEFVTDRSNFLKTSDSASSTTPSSSSN